MLLKSLINSFHVLNRGVARKSKNHQKWVWGVDLWGWVHQDPQPPKGSGLQWFGLKITRWGSTGKKFFFSEIYPFFRLNFFDFFSLPESNSFFLNHFMLHIGCRAGIGDAETQKKFWIFENFYPVWCIFVKITFIAKTPPWELVFVK